MMIIMLFSQAKTGQIEDFSRVCGWPDAVEAFGPGPRIAASNTHQNALAT